MDMDQRAKSFIKTSVNVTKTKIDEGAWKKINCAKIQACTWKNIGPKKKPLSFILCVSFSLKPSF